MSALDIVARAMAARLRVRMPRPRIAVAMIGQSNERGQVSPGETIGGVPSRTAFPQAFASLRNPGLRYPIGPAGAAVGGMLFRLYDDLWDWGYDAQIVNGAIGSMSMLRDAAGQIVDGAAARNFAARQKRDPVGPGDRGYRGDYMVAGGRVFLCTRGRRAYAMNADTFVPGDNAVAQDLDYIRVLGNEATAATAPDFAAATLGGVVVDGTVEWTCVSATTVYLGYSYAAGAACTETRAGFDPFGILRRAHEEVQRVRDARERVVILQNGQSDVGLTSGQYQQAINSVASFFLNRQNMVMIGLSVYNPSGSNVTGYNTLSSATASSQAFLNGGSGNSYPEGRVRAGANLYQLMGSSGDMAAGGANFAKDSGQDNIHLNARGAVTAGGLIADSIKAWLPRSVA